LLNIKRLKVIFLICILCIVITGCNNPLVPPLPSEGDDTYTITVASGNATVFGTVYIDGVSTGIYLSGNSSVQVTDVSAGVEITLVDDNSFESHSETFNPPQTTITFEWF